MGFIKPLGEDFTPGTVEPLRVALVEPVAYQFQLSEGKDVAVKVIVNDVASAPVLVHVASASPGLFRIADPGNPSRRNVAALQAGTAWLVAPSSMANSLGIPTPCGDAAVSCAKPAVPNEVIQLYVTGLGAATPGGTADGVPLATGVPAPASGNPLYTTVQTPVVLIGGMQADVLFSGLAPGFMGLYQLNVRVPANTDAGSDIPIVISTGGMSDTATLAVAAQ